MKTGPKSTSNHTTNKRNERTPNHNKPAKRALGLRVIRENVAGIDLGSREHWVCCPGADGQEPQVKTFTTTTPQLEKLADWLEAEGIESVAMEATSVYWIPLYELLEERGIEPVLVKRAATEPCAGAKERHDRLPMVASAA